MLRRITYTLCCLVALISVLHISTYAFADGAPAAAQQQVFDPAPLTENQQHEGFMPALLRLLPMLAICYFIFYFMVVKPQDKRVKEQKGLLESLKRGYAVLTSGGIVGKFSGVEKEFVVLEVSNNVKVKVDPAHIAKKVDESPKVEVLKN